MVCPFMPQGLRPQAFRPSVAGAAKPAPLTSYLHQSLYPHRMNVHPDYDTHFWDTIFSTDITSAEGLSNIAALVHSPSKVTAARGLRGGQAQDMIDLIDRVSDPLNAHRPLNVDHVTQLLVLPHLDQKLFRRCSRLLYKICKTHGILPASYVVRPDLTNIGEFGWGGGFADVSKGEYRGDPVAIKHLRIKTRDEFDKIFKVSDFT